VVSKELIVEFMEVFKIDEAHAIQREREQLQEQSRWLASDRKNSKLSHLLLLEAGLKWVKSQRDNPKNPVSRSGLV